MSTEVLEFATESEYDWWEENCAVIPPDIPRVFFIGVAGCLVASISVLFNMFLFYILGKNRKHRSSHLLYLTFLALFDVFISGAYILLFPVNIYMDYFENEWLANAWYTYMPSTLACSHIAITGSAFLIVAAAFERYRMEVPDPRYVTTSKIRTQFAKRNRLLISIGALVFALIAKGPMFFELKVVPNQNCTGVTKWTAERTLWSEREPYATVYKFWFRNILTIVLPFFLCFYLNIQIIRRLRLQHQGAKLFRFATSEHRQNIRSATLMLVFVTCSYLASNAMNVIVYIMEMTDMQLLMDANFRNYYTYITDLVSFLTVASSALRLPIYYGCNARIRVEVLDTLDYWSSWICPKESVKAIRCRPNSTVRYCHNGNGYMIYETRSSCRGETKPKCYGTGFDRIVLSVAIGGIDRRFSATPRLISSSLGEMESLKPILTERRVSDFN